MKVYVIVEQRGPGQRTRIECRRRGRRMDETAGTNVAHSLGCGSATS